MNTMLKIITPKSDQLNADDLIGGRSKTIKITQVSLNMSEQPCTINYEGDNGKPYKPGKSMCRVLVKAWGPDANNYVGKSLTLYCDENVKFGAAKVGGIRISHMSDIPEAFVMALTETRASRKPFSVKPLVAELQQTKTIDETKANELKSKLTKFAEAGTTSLANAWNQLNQNLQKSASGYKAELDKIATDADAKASPGSDEIF